MRARLNGSCPWRTFRRTGTGTFTWTLRLLEAQRDADGFAQAEVLLRDAEQDELLGLLPRAQVVGARALELAEHRDARLEVVGHEEARAAGRELHRLDPALDVGAGAALREDLAGLGDLLHLRGLHLG